MPLQLFHTSTYAILFTLWNNSSKYTCISKCISVLTCAQIWSALLRLMDARNSKYSKLYDQINHLPPCTKSYARTSIELGGKLAKRRSEAQATGPQLVGGGRIVLGWSGTR
jgi:hypothetical protein